MSNILLTMIHARAEATKPEIDLTVKNYGVWVLHWFKCAEEIAKEFDNNNLPNTAKAVRDIIVEQMRYSRSYFNETQSSSSAPSTR